MDFMDENKDEKKEEEEKKKESNLWRDFLKSAVKSGGRGLQRTGHLIVFGATNSGKASLVSYFGKLENKFVEMKKFLMMRYAYCHLTSTDSEDSYSLLHIWQIAEPSHADVLDVVIPKEDMANVAYMICIDFSKPSLVETEFKKWMQCLTNIQNKLTKRCDVETQEALKTNLYKHIQFYVNPKDDSDQLTDDTKEELEIQRKNPAQNLGVPIIVVATKCDAFRNHFQAEADAEDHFEIMCSYIRWWCIDYGAACFSMSKGLKDQARRILSYIDHRVFDAKFDRGPNAVVKLSNPNEKFLFIPSGFDSKETIKAQNPKRNLEEIPFADFFQSKQKKKKQQAMKPKNQSYENEKFLRTVLFDLNSGGPVMQGKRNEKGGVEMSDFFQRLLEKPKT